MPDIEEPYAIGDDLDAGVAPKPPMSMEAAQAFVRSKNENAVGMTPAGQPQPGQAPLTPEQVLAGFAQQAAEPAAGEQTPELLALQQRVAEMEAAQAAQRQVAQQQREADFKRRLESLPPEERLKEELNWERSRRMEIEMDAVRGSLRSEQPLFVGFMDQLAEHADIEMDPGEFRSLAAVMGPYVNSLIKAEVESRLAQERAALEATYRKQYGSTPNRAAASDVTVPKTPGQNQYEAYRQALALRKKAADPDEIATLLRLRQQAQRGM